jgi:hypothetical protein
VGWWGSANRLGQQEPRPARARTRRIPCSSLHPRARPSAGMLGCAAGTREAVLPGSYDRTWLRRVTRTTGRGAYRWRRWLATGWPWPQRRIMIVMTSQFHAQPGVAEAPSPSPRVRWWKLPFSADTWRRTFYILLALPVSLVSVPLVLLGGYRAGARLQRGLARRYLLCASTSRLP